MRVLQEKGERRCVALAWGQAGKDNKNGAGDTAGGGWSLYGRKLIVGGPESHVPFPPWWKRRKAMPERGGGAQGLRVTNLGWCRRPIFGPGK